MSCKSYRLDELKKTKAHFFWHQGDYTITSKGFIWVYPGKPLLKNSTCALPEKNNMNYSECYGICTDYINQYVKI